ncbi:hypothetical protein EV182_006151 [Spiromyces aspiralis]|uniref:Uncharacterized protein n=1 Tax=Spiromyces aspiralis TaxID=68401 RepID=A0ACC1H926_9FUNG|nr:hypothetical protein EV182_006151 [Spiromyces aspiralis]
MEAASSSGSEDRAGKLPLGIDMPYPQDPLEINMEDWDCESRQLFHFDLDPRFGPCLGISRLLRWDRAKKLGMDPPVTIKMLLQRSQHEDLGAQDDDSIARKRKQQRMISVLGQLAFEQTPTF